MSITSFENLEKQWKEAERLYSDFNLQLISKATELGVSVIQVHDTLEFSGLLESQNKLLAWMKKKLEDEHPR